MFLKLYNIPFWIICTSLVMGGYLFPIGYIEGHWFFVWITLLILLMYLFKNLKSLGFITISCALFFLLGGLRYQLSMSKGKEMNVTNVLPVGKPIEAVFEIIESYRGSENWSNYKVLIRQIEKNSVSENVLLKVKKKDTLPLTKGMMYTGVLILNRLNEGVFPYGFQYNNYLSKQGIEYLTWSDREHIIALFEQENKWKKSLIKTQNGLSDSLEKNNLDSDVIQFTKALVLGDKKGLEKKLSNKFAKAGVMHVLAISGLHIGIIYMVLLWMLKLLLYRYKYRVLRSVIIVLLLWAFVWFSGTSPSALRAVTMFTCFEVSQLLLRRQHPLNALIITIFILFLIDPKIIFLVGFQFSVIAVASIIIGMPKLNKLWVPQTRLGTYLWAIICVSLCAQVGLLPLSIFYFHQIPTLFLMANIPVMICIPFVMCFAMLIVFGSQFLELPVFLYSGYNFIINGLINFVSWVASFEVFVLEGLYISEYTVIGCYLVCIYMRWWYSNFRKGMRYLFLPFLCVLTISFGEINRGMFKKEIWLLNDYKNTSLIEVLSDVVNIYSEKMTDTFKKNKIKPILDQLHIEKVSYKDLKNVYRLGNTNLLVVNDEFVPNLKVEINVVLLSNSPKINLDRLIKHTKPSQIIIASSNKTYLIDKWEATCKSHQILFWNVQRQGDLELIKFFKK